MNINQQNPGGGGGGQNVPPVVAAPNQANVAAVPVNGGITATGQVWTGGSGDPAADHIFKGKKSTSNDSAENTEETGSGFLVMDLIEGGFLAVDIL